MKHISFKDFEDEKGRVDWKRYNQAKKDNGDVCCECGCGIFFGNGYPRKCGGCEDMHNKKGEDVAHDSHVRCPKCLNIFSVHDNELYELYEEGEHEIGCPECGHDFVVETAVSYTFTSPATVDSTDEDEESGEAEE